MKMNTVLLMIVLSLFLSNCVDKKEQKKNQSYQSKIVLVNKNINFFITPFKENENIYGLDIEVTNKKDSLLEIKKYVLYEKHNIIDVSSEFSDNIYKYHLKKGDKNDLIISLLDKSKDSLLFGFKLKKIVLEYKPNPSKPNTL